MLTASAKIFLAADRGFHETNSVRSQRSFNFGNYLREGRERLGDLYLLNDDMLDGDRSLTMMVEEYSWVILLPVIGAIQYKDAAGNENLVAAGQMQLTRMKKNSSYEVTNPFKEDLVNFLQIWFKADAFDTEQKPCLTTYDVNEFANALLKISPQQIFGESFPFNIAIGKFSGRAETIYHTANSHAAFLFVLEGAFETAGRLLHARDGLALTGAAEIDMEALSNDAIMLLIELPISSLPF